MATWMAHLRIAENLLAYLPDLDAAHFAVGSVTPDSGVPDENWENFDPPPQVTHFKKNRSVHKDIADLEFYRGYLSRVPLQDVKRFSFRLGYFFHLITDNLWTMEVGRPTQERFAEQFAADDQFIWEVKLDWYGLDFVYLRAHPDCPIWKTFLKAEPLGNAEDESDPCHLDFLPAQAMRQQLAHIKTFYQRQDDEILAMLARPFVYLSQFAMDRFVEQANSQLLQIYRKLWPLPPTGLSGYTSSLELFT